MIDIEINIERRQTGPLAPDARVRYVVKLADEVLGVWSDPEHSVARLLLEQDWVSEEDKLVVCRNGKRTMTGSVGWFAKYRVSETRAKGPSLTKYRVSSFLQGQASDDEEGE